MPKNLSLKKAQQSGSVKNQKSITQFFKSDNNSLTQDPRHGLCNMPTNGTHNHENSNKRKASSPVTPSITPKKSINQVTQEKATKKMKVDHNGTSKSPTGTSILKLDKSPCKRNNENISNHKMLSQLDKESLSRNIQSDKKSQKIEERINRSPLSSNIENIESCSNQWTPTSSPIKVNHVNNMYVSPKKKSINNHDNDIICSLKDSPTLRSNKNSPTKADCWSPKSLNVTPKKVALQDSQPSVKGNTVKALSFTDNDEAADLFEDEWEITEIDELDIENLNLSVMQRCEVINVCHYGTHTEIKLKNSENNRGTCLVKEFWMDTPLCIGDIVSIIASRDSSGKFCVNNTSGLLVLRPDHLVSSTSVVAGVFCKRKAVLQERWRGLDSANASMTIGILIHELVQKALTQHITDVKQLNIEADKIIEESIQLLFDAGITEEEVKSSMKLYIPPLGDFMQTYFTPNNGAHVGQKGKWNGNINKVLDIEENLCCPQLGLKGKIDATLQVTIHEQKGRKQKTLPLEIKSGKASMSAEHRGQLVLYGMMLSAQWKEDPTVSEQRGLLLYLKERVDLREISCGYPERRDLIMLRNQLVQNLTTGPQDIDPEQLIDIEDASALLQQKLPEPIHRESICTKCPYLTICSLHLWHTDGPKVSDDHPLSVNRELALGHLSPDHIKYFLHWTALLKMEERVQVSATPLHSLWTNSIEAREKRGTCIANLHLKCVEGSGAKYVHIFLKHNKEGAQINGENISDYRGPQEGEYCIVSLIDRPWIAAGTILHAKNNEIHMLLERDLSRRLTKTTKFHIDTYESYATTVQNLTNLGVLLDDSDRSHRLRRLIIDKETPEFEMKLGRDVGRLGAKLMRSLNIEQQRAVLKALAAKDYALLKGLPGTGKTQTISVLIQMLVALKQRVLVTAHTHSAVDTVLSRLPNSIHIMRLGPKSRVAGCLVDRCEHNLAASCDTTKKLELLYNSMQVVGVTCLGAAHAMLTRTTFDVCIVDEATQVLQSTVLRPLFAANRFILVGDPEQLPPVVRSKAAIRLGMEQSLFHRLMREEATCTLHLQYRMNKPLADVANLVAYDGQLKCASEKVANSRLDINIEKLPNDIEWLLKACSPEPDHAVVFLDLKEQQTENKKNSRTCANKTEACLVLALVESLIKGGISSSDVGIIAPYRDQVSLLRRSLAGQAEVSTVDQFQGRDKNVIIYSCTRTDSQEHRKVKDGEVLNDQRRLAVSVTRAKHKLIVVGDSRALQRYEPLQRLIRACNIITMTQQHICDTHLKYMSRIL